MSLELEHSMGSPSEASAAWAELREGQQSLWRLAHSMGLVMLILIGSVSLFLLREVMLIRRQIRDLTQVVSNYEQTSMPAMVDFRSRLYDYAKLNPEFMTIFTKYFTPTSAPPAGASILTSGTPATPGPARPQR